MPWNKHFRDSKAIITRTLELAHASESESTRILERYDSIVDSTVEALNAGDIYIGIRAENYALGIAHKFTPRVFKWCIIAKLKEEGLPIDDLHADIIQTMIPADAPRWTIAKQSYFDAIYKRIKWRLRQVSDSGLDLAIFENVPTDTPLSDDLSIIQSAKQTAQSRDESAQATQSGGIKRKRINHIPYNQALAILEKLNCPKNRKTLERWMKGKNTPDDFTPERMATVEAFTAWATIYARREQSKINTNNALRIDNPNSRKMQKFR